MLTTRALRPPRALEKQPSQIARPFDPRPPEPVPPPAASDSILQSTDSNPLRRFAFLLGLAMIFLRVGVVPELLYSLTGVNTYLLLIVGPPAILGALLSGALQRTYRYKAAWLWTGFFLWMVFATGFSYWKGGSFQRVMSYGRVDFVYMIVAGGLATSWKEVRAIFYTIAAAAVCNLGSARLFAHDDMGGRLNMGEVTGTIGNSNDLAAHLLLVLPFAWFVVREKRLFRPLRYALLPALFYGSWIILRTGSRGALVAMGVVALFVLARSSFGQRIALAAAMAMIAVGFLAYSPQLLLDRLSSFSNSEHREAEESYQSREYLLRKSIEYTLQFPLFGVGPDQFANYEGFEQKEAGKRGAWHVTHNVFTQVSAECGIPGLIFFLGGLGSAFFLVNRIYKRAKREGHPEIAQATFCYMTGLIGYLAASTFLANAYGYQLAAAVGLATSIATGATRHMDARKRMSAPAPVPAPAGRVLVAR